VRIVDYDPAWPEMAAAEMARLAAALGEVAVRTEHVGSTAVPGMAAKPIVDLQVSVAAIEPTERYARHELRHVALRDYLRAHPEEATRYGEVKRELVALRPGDRLAYIAGKADHVAALERRALDWLN
jgi:GrpB-like predicted nucleotidyltransferase (UPF0157 family)